MRVIHINCGIFEVVDYDNTTIFFVGTIEACELFIRRFGE
jgi:hypothetical protein